MLNPGNKPAISKTEVQERIRKIRRAPTEGQNSSSAIKQDFFDESESRGIVEALMPSGCFSKMTFEDLKAFGARSTFIDDLAVFRFRAFITEKSRTQKGQVSFDNAYNIFDDEAKGYVDFKTCLKALKNCGQNNNKV